METWQLGLLAVAAIFALLLVIGITVALIRGVLGTSDIIDKLGRIERLLRRIDRRLAKKSADPASEGDDLADYL